MVRVWSSELCELPLRAAHSPSLARSNRRRRRNWWVARCAAARPPPARGGGEGSGCELRGGRAGRSARKGGAGRASVGCPPPSPSSPGTEVRESGAKVGTVCHAPRRALSRGCPSGSAYSREFTRPSVLRDIACRPRLSPADTLTEHAAGIAASTAAACGRWSDQVHRSWWWGGGGGHGAGRPSKSPAFRHRASLPHCYSLVLFRVRLSSKRLSSLWLFR